MQPAVRFLIALLLAVPVARAQVGVPLVEGPDIPPQTEPDAVVEVFEAERYECNEGARTRTIAVPDGDWDRIILTVTVTPDGDPWDRLLGVGIGGVEVLRATTPRTEMTLQRDITPYASLLPPGGTADVTLQMGSWVGALEAALSLSFYADEPTAPLVARRIDRPVGAFAWRALTGHGRSTEATIDLGETAPSSAQVEITLSSHSDDEAWFLVDRDARIFRVFIDDIEVGFAQAMPYTYAFLGFGNANANTACVGPGTSAFGDTVHPVMWWTGHRLLDAAGVHGGVGEIPPYRAVISSEHLPLLTDERTIRLEQFGGLRRWITSVSFLLED